MIRTALVAVTGAALVAGAGLATAAPAKPAKPVKLGPNLVANSSFEESSVDTATDNGIPVLPVGWTVEGATILFDYHQRGGRTGPRAAAVSGSLAPGRQACDASASGTYMCVDNPAHPVTGPANEQATTRASVRPFWVSQAAMPVTAGKAYRFSVWAIRPSLDPNAGVVGEGAATKVRWLANDGSTVAVTDGPSHLKTDKRDLGYKQVAATVTAPAGAVGAKVLLGHSDWTVTSAQVSFDDVAFQQLG